MVDFGLIFMKEKQHRNFEEKKTTNFNWVGKVILG